MKFFSITYLFSGLIFSMLTSSLLAQEVKVQAGFFADSAGVGEQTKFYLTARYPSKITVLFPDSTFNFTPFEFNSKQYFATKTTEGISYDSVIYSLSTFEIEKIQTLSLPVYAVGKMDSVAFNSNRDTLLLAELVGPIPDSISAERLPLKLNTSYKDVSFLFNYPILVIILIVLVVAALVTFFVFGKKIRKYLRIKRLTKDHTKFLQLYGQHLDEAKKSFTTSIAESTMATWKKYMEQLEVRPYTKLTTREILLVEKNDSLGHDLHAIDRAIYGHAASVVTPLENLREYAVAKFLKKLEEVKHG